MRPIDADALKASLGIDADDCDKCHWGHNYGRCRRGGDFEDACCAIDDAPTIEPERRTGRWIKEANTINCSACKQSNWSLGFEHLVSKFNFCPNCGSYMGGDES